MPLKYYYLMCGESGVLSIERKYDFEPREEICYLD